jgi:hypothetical protein
VGEKRNVKRRDHFGDPGIDENIILKSILKKYDWRMWTGFIWRL